MERLSKTGDALRRGRPARIRAGPGGILSIDVDVRLSPSTSLLDDDQLRLHEAYCYGDLARWADAGTARRDRVDFAAITMAYLAGIRRTELRRRQENEGTDHLFRRFETRRSEAPRHTPIRNA